MDVTFVWGGSVPLATLRAVDAIFFRDLSAAWFVTKPTRFCHINQRCKNVNMRNFSECCTHAAIGRLVMARRICETAPGQADSRERA
jgi:hypothetical protein